MESPASMQSTARQQPQTPVSSRGRRQPAWHLLADHAVAIGFTTRLLMAWLLPLLLDDGRFIPGVAYTDIDFYVFSDAAQAVRDGGSPYDRHTYRYTPFLAQMLAYMSKDFARYLFCIADAMCGWIILWYRRNNRRHATNGHDDNGSVGSAGDRLLDACWWMYNPLAINICTRGSNESLVVLLPVLLTLWRIQASPSSVQNAMLAGICHGLAIHSKLYPIIYSLSFMVYLAPAMEKPTQRGQASSSAGGIAARIVNFIIGWAKRLLTAQPMAFLLTSIAVFASLTLLGVRWYGEKALQEGLLYHFSRVDHRHNYSMYWYWIYLTRSMPTITSASIALMGRLLLIPQIMLLVVSSLGLAKKNLALALFAQTYLFVIHNKVITGQYFTWFLCLLPLCTDALRFTPRVQMNLAGVLLSIGLWLGSAYCLEIRGMAVHRWNWLASVVFFWMNTMLLGALLSPSVGSKSASGDGDENDGGDRDSDDGHRVAASDRVARIGGDNKSKNQRGKAKQQ